MKLAIMQPYFFPYLGYFQLIDAVDKFVFLDDVNFIRKGWVNRNRILVNGNTHLFTLPIKGASQNIAINALELNNEPNSWSRKLIETVRQSYKKSPYQEDGIGLLERVLGDAEKGLASICRSSIREVLDYLGMSKDFVFTSAIYDNQSLKGDKRILDICQREGATMYINLPGGRELYDSEVFLKDKIELRFISSEFPEYAQFSQDFVPGLSILDIVMNCSKDQIRSMMTRYTLE